MTGTKVTLACHWCGEPYLRPRSQEHRSRFCSRKCRSSWVAVIHLNKNIKTRDYSGSKNPCWRGGRNIRPDGYIRIYKPEHPYAVDTYVMEHRLVMEEKLGRLLDPHEIVHHINEDKSDNRPENLELIANQAQHAKIHLSDAFRLSMKGRNHTALTRAKMSESQYRRAHAS